MDAQPDPFAALVDRYKERVYMLALQMTHNHSDADELSQQAFLRAYESFGSFRGDSDFFTWIYRITVNLCLTHLKNQKRWVPLPEPQGQDEPSAPEIAIDDPPDAALQEDDTKRQIWRALDTLSPELRAAIVLVYLQDQSPRQAAASIGCAEATVHWRLFKARKLLKKALS
jgi:RNA polymerase sigma-70 factor (ECF subfamily)